MILKLGFTIIVALATLTATPAAAEFLSTRGGWDIYRDDDSCNMEMEFEGSGETLLALVKGADGVIVVAIGNYAWSAREGDSYEVAYVLNGSQYSGGKAIGTSLGGRKGFISKLEAGFEEDFRKGSSLHVYLGDTRIDQLSLSGTAVAMDAVNRCLVGVKAKIAADDREKARWAHLPKDPFVSKPSGQLDGASQRSDPIPRGSPGSWVSANDYPSAAWREQRAGITEFRVIVGPDGRVSSCFITSSSGHSDLDETVCKSVSRRARFIPASDDKGNPTSGTYSQKVTWNPDFPQNETVQTINE